MEVSGLYITVVRRDELEKMQLEVIGDAVIGDKLNIEKKKLKHTAPSTSILLLVRTGVP